MLLAALSFAIRRIWQTIYKEVKDSGSLPLYFVHVLFNKYFVLHKKVRFLCNTECFC